MPEPIPEILQFARPPAAQPSPALTVRAAVALCLADKAAQERTGTITAVYLGRLRDHLSNLAEGDRGSMPVAELRPSTARQWLAANEQWKSPHTLENAYRSLRGLIRWLDAEELIARDPLRSFRRFWPPPQPRGACRVEEYEALMRTARSCNGKGARRRSSRGRFRLQLWFLWETGCRTCELRAAEWAQVDWTRGLLVMAKSKTTRATGQARVIPLSARVMRVLRWLERRRLCGKNIFTARGGRPLEKSSWNRLFRKYARIAGVRESVTLYTLRHGFCVAGLEAGVGDAELALVMGHTTTRYIQWYGRDLREKTDHLRDVAGRVRSARKKPTAEPPSRPTKQSRTDQPTLFDE